MKLAYWLLLGTVFGVTVAAAVGWAVSPRRGGSIELLPTPSPGPVVVHVKGAVYQPGIYSLPPTSRVEDAVQAAGGMLPEANSQAVNLASRLKDGDQVIVPLMAQALPTSEFASRTDPEGVPLTDTEPGPSGPLNLNTATLDELQTLPGIGPTKAEAILDYRREHGGFQSIEELQNVTGIGPVTFEKLKDQITVD